MFSALTGIHWKPEDVRSAELPDDTKDRELGKGYKSREELDREIADFEAHRITSYMTLNLIGAGRANESIRHAKGRIPIEIPGKVSGDSESPLTNTLLIGSVVAAGGAALYFFAGENLHPSPTPDDTLPNRLNPIIPPR